MSTQTYSTNQQAYAPGFHMAETSVFKSEKGLSKKVVEQISEMKGEPNWMRQFRLKSLALFEQRPMPTWGADLTGINFDDRHGFICDVLDLWGLHAAGMLPRELYRNIRLMTPQDGYLLTLGLRNGRNDRSR